MKSKKHYIPTVLLFLCAGALPAAEFFVSPAGNDSNNGVTPQAAFRTLSAAAKATPVGAHTIRVDLTQITFL